MNDRENAARHTPALWAGGLPGGARLDDRTSPVYADSTAQHGWGEMLSFFDRIDQHPVGNCAAAASLAGAGIAEPDMAEYNRQTDREWQGIRDFLVLHYHANDRPEPFWQACRAAPLPDSLAHRLDLFRSAGRTVREGDELFTEVGWLQVMLGQNIAPAGYHPLVYPGSRRHRDLGRPMVPIRQPA